MAELKQKTILEVKKEDKFYAFICDPSESLGNVYDALVDMLATIVQRINDSVPKQDQSQPSDEEK